MQLKICLLATALFAALPAAHAADAAKWTNGMLTDAAGNTLYTFDHDAKGKSNCNGGCAAAWPPAAAAADANTSGDFSVISRDDGAKQWTYKGMPLYRFSGDQKPGDAHGDNSGSVWHAVRSAKTAVPAASGNYGYGSGY